MPGFRQRLKSPRSIQAHLIALVAAVAVPLVALQALSSYREYVAALEGVEQEALALAEATSVSAYQFLSVAQSVMSGVSARFGPVLLQRDPCQEVLAAVSGVVTFVITPLVVDSEGDIVCSVRPDPEGTSSVAQRDWFQEIRRGKDFSVGVPYQGGTEAWLVPLAVPILDGSGAFIGAFAGSMPLLEFRTVLARISSQKNELVTVFTQDGIIVARSIDADVWVGRQLSLGDGLAPVVAPGQETASGADLHGVERAWGRAQVPGVKWSVYAGVPAERAYGAAILAARERAGFSIVIILLVGLLAAGFHRRIAGSLRALVEGTRAAIDGTPLSATEHAPAEVFTVVEQFNQTLEEQIRAKSSERQVRARYQSLFDNAVFGIYLATPGGRLLEVNAALVAMLGFSSTEELLATPLTGLYRDPSLREKLVERYKASTVIDQLEVEWVRADGQPIVVRLNGKVIRTEGDRAGYEVIVEDVTEEKRREDELRQTQRMEAVGRLAGGIAHDFNNLLTVIGGNVELLQCGLPEDDPLHHDIRQIVDATDRAAALTRQLLAFSRKECAESGSFDLNEILANLETMLVRLIGEDVRLETRLSEAPQLVNGDPGKLEQVVMNLVLNARDALGRGGHIMIETCAASESCSRKGPDHGEGVRLTVRDNGTGMDEETRIRIFEPFFTTKPKGEGTGLGLSTVYGIVRQAEGHIHVESQLGRGTTFEIWFPVAEEKIAIRRSEEPLLDGPSEGQETILAVEDEDLVRGIVCRVLEDAGYRVLVASDGQEALELADAYPGSIDLLLTDVVMPRVKGPELAARLGTRRPETPVLFMSGYTGNLLSEHDIGDDPDAFLAKPFSPTDLTTRVRRILDKRAAATHP